MKYPLALVLSLAVLSGCGGGDNVDADQPAPSPSPSTSPAPEASEPAATTGFVSADELRAAVLDAEPDLTCSAARVHFGGDGPNIFYDQGRVNGADECAAPGGGRVFLSFWENEEDKEFAIEQHLADYKSAGLPVLAGSNWTVTGSDHELGSLHEALGGELLT